MGMPRAAPSGTRRTPFAHHCPRLPLSEARYNCRHAQSPQAFADLMRRLRLQLHAKEESDSVLQYLSTHAATEERIQRAEQQR
jgi:hypothetical protein